MRLAHFDGWQCFSSLFIFLPELPFASDLRPRLVLSEYQIETLADRFAHSGCPRQLSDTHAEIADQTHFTIRRVEKSETSPSDWTPPEAAYRRSSLKFKRDDCWWTELNICCWACEVAGLLSRSFPLNWNVAVRLQLSFVVLEFPNFCLRERWLAGWFFLKRFLVHCLVSCHTYESHHTQAFVSAIHSNVRRQQNEN